MHTAHLSPTEASSEPQELPAFLTLNGKLPTANIKAGVPGRRVNKVLITEGHVSCKGRMRASHKEQVFFPFWNITK